MSLAQRVLSELGQNRKKLVPSKYHVPELSVKCSVLQDFQATELLIKNIAYRHNDT